MTRDEKIAKIKALRKDGKSYDEIAKALKLSPQRIGYYVRTLEGKTTKTTAAKKKTATKTPKKSAPKKKSATKLLPGERASEAAMRLAKPQLDALKKKQQKTETNGAKRAREAQDAYAKAHGLKKMEKIDLSAAAAAVQG